MWNTVPMRPLRTQKPFNAWGVALAYLVGTAVLVVTVFLAAWAGLFLSLAMGFLGAADDLRVDDLMPVAVAVVVALMVLSLAVQARFIRRRGGARPVAGPVAALIASSLMGLAATATRCPRFCSRRSSLLCRSWCSQR